MQATEKFFDGGIHRRKAEIADRVAAASLADRSIKLHFIPDGKSKNMSAISHKLDAKEIAGGKGKADGANRAEAKKLLAGSSKPQRRS